MSTVWVPAKASWRIDGFGSKMFENLHLVKLWLKLSTQNQTINPRFAVLSATARSTITTPSSSLTMRCGTYAGSALRVLKKALMHGEHFIVSRVSA